LDKLIYPCARPDGTVVKLDPRAVQHALDVCLGGSDKFIDAYWGKDDQAAKAAAVVLGPAVCRTFGLPEDPGLAAWTGVLWDFLEWLEKNVATAASSPT
jgi:hypothetical protein